jgi:hypothetical protein
MKYPHKWRVFGTACLTLAAIVPLPPAVINAWNFQPMYAVIGGAACVAFYIAILLQWSRA